ncbi:hypothetical protein [Pseudomonas laurylsulfatiphila]|uniref:hypothetical protein n=1 Tax=Pseudomonas laurylsulfatiphila TaxID=2011015 RepID=UPI002160D62C|nr:hypothetical protein [Pseudomonas laurylsulfatiphila]UVM07032.1 hypothetical protein LOY25_10135 [Pseudomonas laurylsulfatiphila]
MSKRLRKLLIISGALFALGLLINSLTNRGTCSYYGFQTDRETKYAAFVGCMVKVSGNWVLRSELRAVQ